MRQRTSARRQYLKRDNFNILDWCDWYFACVHSSAKRMGSLCCGASRRKGAQFNRGTCLGTKERPIRSAPGEGGNFTASSQAGRVTCRQAFILGFPKFVNFFAFLKFLNTRS